MPPPSSRIPPLLHPYVRLPPAGSLHLLTSILGASTNWLVIRYLCSALGGSDARRAHSSTNGDEQELGDQGEDVSVILVSFLRGWEFWKTESRRAGGLDLARLAQQNRFAFIDGLSNLFLPADVDASAPAPTAAPSSPLPVRTGRTITPRNPPQSPATATATRPTPHASAAPAPTFTLTAPTLSALSTSIQNAQTHLTAAAAPKRVLLILDAPDLLLAAAASTDPHLSSDAAITPTTLAAILLTLRASVHATVLSLSADTPLVAAAVDAISAHNDGAVNAGAGGRHNPLEVAHAAFVVGQAHVADWVLSLRLLDTGFAADVSGVLRVTRGDNEDGDEEEEEEEEEGMEEKEVLYYVGGDGSVRVFERGAGGGNG